MMELRRGAMEGQPRRGSSNAPRTPPLKRAKKVVAVAKRMPEKHAAKGASPPAGEPAAPAEGSVDSVYSCWLCRAQENLIKESSGPVWCTECWNTIVQDDREGYVIEQAEPEPEKQAEQQAEQQAEPAPEKQVEDAAAEPAPEKQVEDAAPEQQAEPAPEKQAEPAPEEPENTAAMEAAEAEAEAAPEGHPKCRQEEDCIGTKSSMLVQNFPRNSESGLHYPGDLYCWECYESFKSFYERSPNLVFMLAPTAN